MRALLVITIAIALLAGCGGKEAPERSWDAHAACLMEQVDKGATGLTAVQACKDLEPEQD